MQAGADRELPILVLSNIIIDDLWLADGTHLPGTLGGAATYAAVGAAVWYPKVAIVAGVGSDLDQVTRNQLSAFGLMPNGHLVRDAHSILSKLVYQVDGSRTETPAHGRTHFERLQLTPADIPSELLPSAGAYVFRDLDPRFWSDLAEIRDRLGVTLWELQDDSAHPQFWPTISKQLKSIDHFSLNRAEASRLFAAASIDETIDQILSTGVKSVLLRLGEEGAVIATPDRRLRLRPPPSTVIDVTGGGNSFCGGYLGGWVASGGDVEQAARSAAASAAHALSQYGPGNPMDRPEIAGRWAAETSLTDWSDAVVTTK